MTDRPSSFFDTAETYDERIDWPGRLQREIPFLQEFLGPSQGKKILDAGCGTGRHAIALAEAGYSVTGADCDAGMLDVARRNGAQAGLSVRWIRATYGQCPRRAGGAFDGCLCLGNALAAARTPANVRSALRAFARVLTPGGRLFLQVLNFHLLRRETPCVRAFRVYRHGGKTRIHLKVFHFRGHCADVVSINLGENGTWTHQAGTGRLCAMSPDELVGWTQAAGFAVVDRFGDYQRSAFDPDHSQDLLLVAAKSA